ncbi:PepSY domain-containing protein [Acetobacter sp. LMG 1627]|uniref:PepSY domain-containing protein n=2 Tax=Acetobacter conturbans TaxID=1737472 RepID=A0ABX0K1D6_9PROT|nr:PepSY domain-containing protein [Acetobacter conturbans]
MQDRLRTRMGWLHAWSGFVFGLLLVCIFASGTIAVFDTELTRWLQPEVPPSATALTDEALEETLPTIRKLLERDEKPFITLPSERDPILRVQYHDGHEFLNIPFDPGTGQELAARATVGGTFFYDLHYSLRNGDTGIIFVTFSGLMLLIVLGSGIIIHLKELIPDLLVLRPFSARLRAWLDVHVLASVPFLPFAFMMAYTGTFLHTRSILPPVSYLASINAAITPVAVRAESPALQKEKTVVPALPPLSPLLHDAEKVVRAGQVGFILFLPKNILISRTDASGPARTREHVDFSYDGHFIRHVLLTTPLTRTQQVMEGIHYVRWGGAGMRWLYFISGLATTIMIGSGLVLFLMKRRRLSGGRVIFRLAEGLTVSVLVGFPLACSGFFWGNRLLSGGSEQRTQEEVTVFFLIWAASAVWGMGGCLMKWRVQVWRSELGLLAVLSALLGPLDLLTRSGGTVFHTPTVFAAVDLIALCVAAVAFQIARRLA